ncbi:hypothetical protein [Brevundimonas faecalis]
MIHPENEADPLLGVKLWDTAGVTMTADAKAATTQENVRNITALPV